DLNGDGVKNNGELSVYQRRNIGAARVMGGAIEGEWRMSEAATMFANISWTRGDDTVNRTPLTRIPPTKGVFGQRWRHRNLWVEGYGVLSGAQRRLSPSDRTDARIRPGGTPGFATVNVRGGFKVKG